MCLHLTFLHFVMERLEVRRDGWVGLKELFQRLWSLLSKTGEDNHVTGSNVEILFIICHVLSSAFLGGSNVDFIALETGDFLVDPSENPCPIEKSTSLQSQIDLEEKKGGRDGHEEDGEGRRRKPPRNGTDDRRNESAEKTRVEELLRSFRDAKNGRLARSDIRRSDLRDEEHAGHDTELSPNHVARKVDTWLAIFALEKDFACLPGPHVFSSFVFLQLGDSKVGNLGCFKQANDAHENKEEDNSGGRWNTFPHRCLALKERSQSHREAEDQACDGKENEQPEEEILDSIAWRLLRFYFLPGERAKKSSG